jgi:hypothetical protein
MVVICCEQAKVSIKFNNGQRLYIETIYSDNTLSLRLLLLSVSKVEQQTVNIVIITIYGSFYIYHS